MNQIRSLAAAALAFFGLARNPDVRRKRPERRALPFKAKIDASNAKATWGLTAHGKPMLAPGVIVHLSDRSYIVSECGAWERVTGKRCTVAA